jgi:MYXO-CTERM domain-containing protein
MKRLLPLLLLPTTVLANPLVHSTDFRPNLKFQIVRRLDDGKMQQGRVEQVGEVVILEGDDSIVSTTQNGYGVVFDSRAQNPLDISKRFYTAYSDDFDEIIIFTTFDDLGASGAAAYEVSAQQDIMGIGEGTFDESSSWGSNGRLHAFVNMMKWDQFDYPGVPITDPNNYFYPVLGQEFAHRWLAFMHYRNSDGVVSAAMLGRDQAHWASTLQADGSVMDGNQLTLEADGFYDATAFMVDYSTLDLYGMGLIPASQVQPWFLLKNAKTNKGRTIDPAQYLPTGAKLQGVREDITIDQVLSAEGPRVPSTDQSPHAFRVAFVLLTRPGERAGDVLPIARTLDKARTVWEQQFKLYTKGTGSVCTQVSAPCGAIAAAHIDGGEIVEHGGNNNGVVEPGEPVLVNVHLNNDSQLPARQVVVATEGLAGDAAPVTLGELAPLSRRDVVFAGLMPADAVCGEPITIDVTSTVDGHTFRGFTGVTPGLTEALHVSFAENRAGWVANPDGQDTATKNGWTWGTPVGYRGNSGWVFQPDGCHQSSKCWFTGLQKGHRAQQDSSLAVGDSHLYSTSIDLSQTYQPVLKMWVWFQAIDFSNPMLGGQDAAGVSMAIEGSTDGGKSWATLDTLDASVTAWQERTIPLAGLVDTRGKLMLRFTASNPAPTVAVEAGVDDISLVTLTRSCNPEWAQGMLPAQSPGGCNVGGGEAAGTGALALLVVLFGAAVLRRRRAL